MTGAMIVAAVRTPIGKGRSDGVLAPVHPVDLLAHVLDAAAARGGFDPARVDDVIGGCVSQVGEQAGNVTRHAVLAAGWPERVPATTIDRQCGSSLQAVAFAAQGIAAGAYDLVVAGGVESMGRVPLGSSAGRDDPWGPRLRARYDGPQPLPVEAAEVLAHRHGIARDRMDAWGVRSHQRAAAATADGAFAREIAPVRVADRVIRDDECPRPDASLEAAGAAPPVLAGRTLGHGVEQPRIGPWSSPRLADAAAAVALASAATAARLALPVRGRVVATALAAGDPIEQLAAIVPATEAALARAGRRLGEMDLVEVHEGFAANVLFWADRLGADLDRVNVRGGGIALGHPLGASGARVLTTLLHALEDTGGRLGLAVMPQGGGLSNAMVIERTP